MISICGGIARSTRSSIYTFGMALFISLFGLRSPLHAENPWGPECKALDECLELFKQLPECAATDQQCFWSTELTDQGLAQEVAGFGRSAIAPMIVLLKSGTPTQAARAANVLNEFQDSLSEGDKAEILAAWRRGSPGLELMASSSANPTFVRELMQLVRKNPTPEGREEHTFTNLRDWQEVSNGIVATVAEHIECSEGESCDPVFAKIQFKWLISNYREDEDFASISHKFIEAISNSALDDEGKVAALQLFEPQEYGRDIHRIRGISVPFLRTILDSGKPILRKEAARFLAGYGDVSGKDTFWATAANVGEATRDRISALRSLQRIPVSGIKIDEALKTLLVDPDWDVRRETTFLLARSKSPEAVDLLVTLLRPSDWRLAFTAVSALQNSEDKGVKALLAETTRTYWHPAVRLAIEAMVPRGPKLNQFPESEKSAVEFADKAVTSMNSPYSEAQDFELSRICKSRFEKDGYRFVPDYITGPDVVTKASDASDYNRKHELGMLLNLQRFANAQKLEASLRFQGQLFSGVRNETGSGKLVVIGPNGKDQVVLQEPVWAIFNWNGVLHAIAGGQSSYPVGDAYLYKLVQGKDTKWQVEKLMRLTGSPEVWMAADSTIGILGTEMIMLIHENGAPEWVGCPSPVFP